jgi:hypothetical protein
MGRADGLAGMSESRGTGWTGIEGRVVDWGSEPYIEGRVVDWGSEPYIQAGCWLKLDVICISVFQLWVVHTFGFRNHLSICVIEEVERMGKFCERVKSGKKNAGTWGKGICEKKVKKSEDDVRASEE